MILTVENTSSVGKCVTVFDANGDLIYPLIEANTETGECVILRCDGDGKIVARGGEIVRRRIICKPPLVAVETPMLDMMQAVA